MSLPTPEQVVRLVFEARAAGDVRRVLALMDPDVRGSFGERDGRRVEVDAHRIQADDAEHVSVHGRIRVIDGGSLTDSPAAWRFTVRAGRVVEITPLDGVRRPLRRVA